MTQSYPSAVWPENFSGIAKLFPLPNLVLFPQAVLPLHIFEPRYCEMLVDSLDSDRLIAMALLCPDWESKYDLRPPIASTVCIGKVISHANCEQDRHNILLVGLKRARIVQELEDSKLYRQAKVELLEDEYPDEESIHRPMLVGKLHEIFSQLMPEGLAAQENFAELVGRQLPLGVLTDLIAYAVNLPAPIKMQLLAENNVDIRCRMLTRCLQQKLGSGGCGSDKGEASQGPSDKFPPDFSEN